MLQIIVAPRCIACVLQVSEAPRCCAWGAVNMSVPRVRVMCVRVCVGFGRDVGCGFILLKNIRHAAATNSSLKAKRGASLFPMQERVQCRAGDGRPNSGFVSHRYDVLRFCLLFPAV